MSAAILTFMRCSHYKQLNETESDTPRKIWFLQLVWAKALIRGLSEILIDAFAFTLAVENELLDRSPANDDCFALTARARALAGIPNYICAFCRLCSRLIMSYLRLLFFSLSASPHPSLSSHLSGSSALFKAVRLVLLFLSRLII